VEVPDLRALKGELIALIPPAMLAGRLSSADEPID
jgi:hypothetical protein